MKFRATYQAMKNGLGAGNDYLEFEAEDAPAAQVMADEWLAAAVDLTPVQESLGWHRPFENRLWAKTFTDYAGFYYYVSLYQF